MVKFTQSRKWRRCRESRSRPGVLATATSLRSEAGQLAEPRLLAERRPFAVDAEQRRREPAGDGQQVLDLGYRLVALADCRIHASEILEHRGAVDRVPRDGEQLDRLPPLPHRLLLASCSGEGA